MKRTNLEEITKRKVNTNWDKHRKIKGEQRDLKVWECKDYFFQFEFLYLDMWNYDY